MKTSTPLAMQVDDEEDILAVTKLALELIGGLEIVQFASGNQAIDVALDHEPDLLLLDVMMPDIDGIETLQRLRSIPGFETIPAIFLIAKASVKDREMLMQCGATSFITKPFDPMTLASEIVSIWKEAFQKQVWDQGL